jgi:hypothetical protein
VDDLQEALGVTTVHCQWDHMGLGWIVYPRAYATSRTLEGEGRISDSPGSAAPGAIDPAEADFGESK